MLFGCLFSFCYLSHYWNISFQKNNEILKSEFETFTYTLSKTGKKVFGAVDGAHDDTILSLAFANFAWHTYMKKNGSHIMIIKR